MRRLLHLLLPLALCSCAAGPSLQRAAEAGQLAQIEALLDKGVSVDARDLNGDTALVAAARSGQAKAIKLLLDRGASINARGDLDCTALTAAASKGHLASVKLLARRGADLNLKEYDGKTALLAARHYKHKPISDWLENYKAGAADKDEPPEEISEPAVALDLSPLMKRTMDNLDGVKSDGPEPTSDIDKPGYQFPQDQARLAVVIGIEKYKTLPRALYAARDAAAVRNHLFALGYPQGNVIYLSGPSATKAAIERAIEGWLSRKADKDSTVFVYFSGYGSPDRRSGEAFLMPWDGETKFTSLSAYPVKRMLAALANLKAKTVYVVFDACFSGAGGRSVLAKGDRPIVTRLDDGTIASGRVTIFTAASEDEITSTLETQGHGLFTYYFLKGLSGEARDASGKIDARGLYAYLKPMVSEEARRQNREQLPLMSGAQQEDVIAQFGQ